MREARVQGAVCAVLDGNDIGQHRNTCTQPGAHHVAAARVVPQRNAGVKLFAQVAAMPVNRVIGVRAKMQHRAVHHDVIRADGRGVACQRQPHVQMLA